VVQSTSPKLGNKAEEGRPVLEGGTNQNWSRRGGEVKRPQQIPVGGLGVMDKSKKTLMLNRSTQEREKKRKKLDVSVFREKESQHRRCSARSNGGGIEGHPGRFEQEEEPLKSGSSFHPGEKKKGAKREGEPKLPPPVPRPLLFRGKTI